MHAGYTSKVHRVNRNLGNRDDYYTMMVEFVVLKNQQYLARGT